MISFAFVTKTKAYLITQTTLENNILKLKESQDEVVNIKGNLIHLSGHQGDTYRLKLWIEESALWFENTYKIEITPKILLNDFQTKIYNQLRTRNPYQAQGIFIGVQNESFYLGYDDNYSALSEPQFVATQYGIYFLYGLYDNYYNFNMSHEESINFINLCIKALKDRLILNTSNWRLDVLDLEKNHKIQYIEV